MFLLKYMDFYINEFEYMWKLTLGDETFEKVQHFTYMSSIITKSKDISVNRLAVANKAYIIKYSAIFKIYFDFTLK